MTATVARPDVVDVLKRADGQYAKRAGDDPAIPEYLTALATAVRPLLGQSTAAPVDDVQTKALLADKQRLGDLVEELRKHVVAGEKTFDRQTRELAALKQQLDELRQALAAKDGEINEARAETTAVAQAVLDSRPAEPVDDGEAWIRKVFPPPPAL